jgi:hypothetical protein
LLVDGEIVLRKLNTEMGSEIGVEFDGEDVSGAGDQGCGDDACAGADFDYGAAVKIAERCGDALNGLRVVEKVLSEPGFEWHGLI